MSLLVVLCALYYTESCDSGLTYMALNDKISKDPRGKIFIQYEI